MFRARTQVDLITVDDGEAGERGMSDENELLQRALQKAREMGAGGIILSLDETVCHFGVGGASNSARTRVIRAVAFVYEE